MTIETRAFPMKGAVLIPVICVLGMLVGAVLMVFMLVADRKPGPGQEEAKWALVGFCIVGMVFWLVLGLWVRHKLAGKQIVIDDDGVTALLCDGKANVVCLAWADVERARLTSIAGTVDLSSAFDPDMSFGIIGAAVDGWTIKLYPRTGGAPLLIAGSQVAASRHEELRSAVIEACKAKGVTITRG